MDNIILMTLFIIVVLIVAVVIWLIKELFKFKQEIFLLNHTLEQNNKDIVGLCSAAVSVDKTLTHHAEKLRGIVEKVEDFDNHQQQQTSQPYHNAIQKVRNGANADELITLCGLSREEATLLIRLHSHDES